MTDNLVIPRFGETKYEVLAYVVNYWNGHRYGPTIEEIRAELGLSVRSSVQWHINDLVRDGWLTHIPKKHRTLQPTKRGKKLVAMLHEFEADG